MNASFKYGNNCGVYNIKNNFSLAQQKSARSKKTANAA